MNTYLKTIALFLLCLFYSAFSYGQEYEIFAIRFGNRLHAIPVTDIAVGATGSDSVNTIYMFWLLQGYNERTVLVDAGFTADAAVDPGQIQFTQPDSVLAILNILPAEVTDIIITHPHWDHIGGIDLYPSAMIWMQRADYQYFVVDAWKKNGNSGGFNRKDVEKIQRKMKSGQVTLIDGDDREIIPGIRVYTGSKHTYESQFVKVNSGDHAVVIASDNCKFYYNLEHLLPIPATTDTKGYVENLQRMKTMVKKTDNVIPGHDPLVFQKFPFVAKDVVKIL